MGEQLTLQELSARIGESVEQLRGWCSLGLIGRNDSKEFALEDLQRARLIQFLLRRGINLPAIARADKEQALLTRYMELMFPGGGVGQTYSLREATDLVG